MVMCEKEQSMKSTATRLFRNAVVLSSLLGAQASFAGNYAECIIDDMPGISNVSAMLIVRDACERKYPSRFANIDRGSARGLFGYKSAQSCILKKSASTPHNGVASNISAACWCLYGKPAYDGEKCAPDISSGPRDSD